MHTFSCSWCHASYGHVSDDVHITELCMHVLAADMEVMVSRVAGIMAGVVISLTLAITVYPTSATQVG